MDSRNADILQIKNYLEGKLDARAMYELERRALDDPFLMDAMEGYEAAGNQSKAPAELMANLQSRLEKPKGRVISLSALAMAASVITVLGVGGWWIFSRPVGIKTPVVAQAAADHTSVSPSPLVKEPQIIINKDSLVAFNAPKTVIRSPRKTPTYYSGTPLSGNDISSTSDETAEIASSATESNNLLAEAPVAMRSRVKTDSVPLNEMLVMGYEAQRKKEAKSADKVAVAAVSPSGPISQKVLSGRVVSAEDGQPLPGVSIRIGNTTNYAVTGADGSYSVKLDSLNTNLTYNYIGFNSRKLEANSPLIANVALEPRQNTLNEVVIAKPVNTPADAAYPKTGWENFQKYLNANSVSPNGKNKTYKVSFTVERDGSLSNFEINKADNDVAGQKAIQLIKNGPEWVGSPKGESKKITVTVKFHKPEEKK